MLSGNIDIDRGVTLCITADGVEVYMYKSEPGVYLSAYGSPVSDTLAQRAGFDVVKLGKAKKRRELMAKAAYMIDQDLDADDERTKKVVKERNGYTVTSIGLGRHVIQDPDGQRLTPQNLTKEQAELLFDELVPVQAASAPEAKAKNPGSVAPKSGKKTD